MSDMTPFIIEALLQSKGLPSTRKFLNLREEIHKTIPKWQHLIGFCLCILDDAIRDSGGEMTREMICSLWLGANEEDER